MVAQAWNFMLRGFNLWAAAKEHIVMGMARWHDACTLLACQRLFWCRHTCTHEAMHMLKTAPYMCRIMPVCRAGGHLWAAGENKEGQCGLGTPLAELARAHRQAYEDAMRRMGVYVQQVCYSWGCGFKSVTFALIVTKFVQSRALSTSPNLHTHARSTKGCFCALHFTLQPMDLLTFTLCCCSLTPRGKTGVFCSRRLLAQRLQRGQRVQHT